MINLKLFFPALLFYSFLACGQDDSNTRGEPTEEEDPQAEQETFSNPLLSGGPDPWVIKHENTYYYTHTTGNNLQLWSTPNMEDLEEAKPVTIWSPPAEEEYSIQIWAPELHFINGKWYMYFAATAAGGSPESADENRRMFVLENDSPSPMNTNWEFKGKITDEADMWAIDGTVMQLEDDNYFIWSGWRTQDQNVNTGRQQLYIAKMENPWTLEGRRVMISEPVHDWERHGLVNEGPVTWRNPEGDVYLFYSASGCWTDEYKIGVLELKENDPLDPDSWQKYDEPLFEKSEVNGVYGPGHNSFFKSPDGTEDWILYHANDNPGDGCGNSRKPRMQKISWNEDGFPVLGVPVKTGKELQTPSSDDKTKRTIPE